MTTATFHPKIDLDAFLGWIRPRLIDVILRAPTITMHGKTFSAAMMTSDDFTAPACVKVAKGFLARLSDAEALELLSSKLMAHPNRTCRREQLAAIRSGQPAKVREQLELNVAAKLLGLCHDLLFELKSTSNSAHGTIALRAELARSAFRPAASAA